MYLVRKLRRAGAGVDAEVDRAVDAGLDALHELVGEVLGDDPALVALEQHAPTGGETERMMRRVTDALADAAAADPQFAQRLRRAVEILQRQEGTTVVTASGKGSVAVGGDQTGIVSTGDGTIKVHHR